MTATITLDPQYVYDKEKDDVTHVFEKISLGIMSYNPGEYTQRLEETLPSVLQAARNLAKRQGRKGQSSIVWVSVEANHFGENMTEVFINT